MLKKVQAFLEANSTEMTALKQQHSQIIANEAAELVEEQREWEDWEKKFGGKELAERGHRWPFWTWFQNKIAL